MKAILQFFYRLMAFSLMVTPLYATQSDDLNRIEYHKIYRAYLEDTECEIFTKEEKQALGPTEFLWQDITPDHAGIFQLEFNPELYQKDNLLLFLKHQNKPVAIVTYEHNSFRFLGLKGSNFDLRTPKYQPSLESVTSAPTDWITQGSEEARASFWPNCRIHVQENLTIRDGTFKGKAQIQAQNIVLKGDTFATDHLALQAPQKCQLEDKICADKLKVRTCDLDQKSQIKCQNVCFDVQRGQSSQSSLVHADQDIILKGFHHFIQQGQFRAKRFVLIEGDHLHRSPEAYTFAGALYLTKVSACQDQGKTTAWQHQMNALNILFDETYQFLGHYLFVRAGSDRTSVSNAVLKTAKESQITLGFATHLYSQNSLVHQGNISVSAPLSYHFPLWEYWFGPDSSGRSPHTPEFQSALRQLTRDMSVPRQASKKLLKNMAGVFLEAEGTLEQEGTIQTAFTSLQLKADKILFSGHNQSGFLEANKTVMKANQAIYRGILNAPSGAHFDINQQLELGGYIQANLLQAIAPHITLAGQTKTGTLKIDTSVLKVAKNSSNSAQKSMSLRVQDRLDNQGHLLSQGDISITGVRDYRLGHLHANNCFNFAPAELPNIYDLYYHPDPAFTQNGGLNLVSQRDEVLDQPLDLPFGLGLKAPSIYVKQPITSTADLFFESTQGPTHLEAALSGRTLEVISADEIQTSGLITLTQDGRLKAKGRYSNYQQIMAPQGQIDVEASSIHNVGRHSKIVAQIVTLKARESHIENEGLLQGYTYLEGTAAGNIISKGFADHSEKAPCFIPARIEGGQGLPYRDAKGESRQLGLKLYADGKIDNYVSHFISGVDLFMIAKQGMSHQGDSIRYIAYEDEDSSFLDFNEEKVTVWKDLVGQALIYSEQGRIVSYVPDGGIEYKGAQVRGAQGDSIVVRDQIKYHAFIIETTKEVESSSWWGLSEDSEKETHQDAVVTQIVNDDVVEHVSLGEGIHGQAPYIEAPIYRIRSRKPAIFEGVKLAHHYEIEHNSMIPSFFGSKALKGGSIGTALLNEDPLLRQFSGFRNSRHPASRFASGVKLGVQAWNDLKNLSQAFQAGQPGMFFLERYGNVSLDFQNSLYTHDYTTTASPFFNVGTADFGEVESVKLLDGTILLARDGVILPPHFTLGKATDHSREHYESSSFSLGINVFTGMPSVSYDQSRSQSQQQTHRNALIHIYGHQGLLDATRSQSLDLEGGRIIAPRARGSIDTVNITSYQDRSTSSQSGFGLGVGGSLITGVQGSSHISGGHAHETVVRDHAGLSIDDTSEFDMNRLTVTDTVLDPTTAALAQEVHFNPLQDESSSQSYHVGFSGLNLGSPGAFMNSLTDRLEQGIVGIVASELTRKVGGNDLGASIVGTLASLNQTSKGMSSGLSSGGEISYERDGQHTEIALLEVNLPQLRQEWHTIQRGFQTPHMPLPFVRNEEPSLENVSLSQDDDNTNCIIMPQDNPSSENVDDSIEDEGNIDLDPPFYHNHDERESDFMYNSDDDIEDDLPTSNQSQSRETARAPSPEQVTSSQDSLDIDFRNTFLYRHLLEDPSDRYQPLLKSLSDIQNRYPDHDDTSYSFDEHQFAQNLSQLYDAAQDLKRDYPKIVTLVETTQWLRTGLVYITAAVNGGVAGANVGGKFGAMVGAAAGVGTVYTIGQAIVAGEEEALQELKQRGESQGRTLEEKEKFGQAYSWMGECIAIAVSTKMSKTTNKGNKTHPITPQDRSSRKATNDNLQLANNNNLLVIEPLNLQVGGQNIIPSQGVLPNTLRPQASRNTESKKTSSTSQSSVTSESTQSTGSSQSVNQPPTQSTSSTGGQRIVNPSKAQSPVWTNFKYYSKDTKTNGLHGTKKEYYQWDYTHNDIEVYNHKFKHLGSMDPVTGKMYKLAVKPRTLDM